MNEERVILKKERIGQGREGCEKEQRKGRRRKHMGVDGSNMMLTFFP